MAKFSGTSVVPNQISDLQKRALTELPTGPVEEEVVHPADEHVDPGTFQDLLTPGPTPASPQEAVEEATPVDQQATPVDYGEYQGEVDRQTLPTMKERREGTGTPNKWKVQIPRSDTFAETEADGGIYSRADGMAESFLTGQLRPAISLANTPGKDIFQEGGTNHEVADAIADQKVGSLIAAVNRAGAANYNGTGAKFDIDPDYARVGSMVTENTLAELSAGGKDEATGELTADPISEAVGDVQIQPEGKEPVKITKAAGNERLGQSIHQEYLRMKGEQVPEKLPKEEAETLGDAFKEMWVANNPTFVTRARDADNQVRYQLTENGVNALSKGQADREQLFPSKNVKPVKTPNPKGTLPGQQGQNNKTKLGTVGRPEFGSTIQQAMENLGNVPNVVDKQRSKILYLLALPTLTALTPETAAEVSETWQAHALGLGAKKLQELRAKEQALWTEYKNNPEEDSRPPRYSAGKELEKQANKLAQELRALSQDRHGANYLTYNVQGFNGRITPQQTRFNPTTSKTVRFVTTNAAPSIAKPGGRVDQNLRQMYAMSLVKGADTKLPAEREILLKAESAKLEQYGDRLSSALAMPDEMFEQVSQAVDQGIALDDPNFPQMREIGLNPENELDAEIIEAIKKKGADDAMVYIDGLIDYSKYAKRHRKGQPYPSYFNAYMDGKTNGIATNGIQMGIVKTAEQTGVLRNSTTDLLDNGDMRDALEATAIEMIDGPGQGWKGSVSSYSGEMSDVARKVFGVRDLNKATTMTFGYGKEIASFVTNIKETIDLLAADPENAIFNASLTTLEANGFSRDELAAAMLDQKYARALESVLSKEAIRSRGLMRTGAVMFAAMDSIFAIKSPVGQDLNFGRDMTEGFSTEAGGSTQYRLKGEKVKGGSQEITAAHYQSRETSAAPRTMGEQSIPGEYAYGGSVPGPVQSVDAATVAMTASGPSWQKLKNSSGGNPYLHTIYDAFKVDAMGYDTVLEEVNKNWMKANMEWSYLEQTKESLEKAWKEWSADINSRDPGAPISDSEALYMKWLLAPVEKEDGTVKMGNFEKKIKAAGNMDYRADKRKPADAAAEIEKRLSFVGYDWRSPPAQITVVQYKEFVLGLNKELNPISRLDTMAKHTQKNKQKLAQELKTKGFKTRSGESIALQYYAH